MLCPHALFRAEENRFGAYTTVTSCQSSSKTCPECDLLLRLVEEYKPGWLNASYVDDQWKRALYIVRQHTDPGVIRLKEGRPGNFPEESWDWFENLHLVGSFRFFRKAEGDILSPRDQRQPIALPWESLEIVKDSSSAAAFERASAWLAYCEDHDENCSIPNPNFTPRRLLHVGTAERNQEPFLFEPTAPTSYVCLSYCWGADTTDVLTTTTHNLQAHYQAVPLAAMPQTIRDAVTVCRALKLENLWVDSFCITQDDTADWLQQSSQMRDIYANAHITIAAEEPASCKLGFLGGQKFGKPEWQRVFTTHVPKEAGGPDHQVLIRPGKEDEGHERCSLDKRGWCLQESILPSRRLCFNGKEMSWECGSRKICECGHASWAESLGYETVGSRIKQGYDTAYPQSGTPNDDWKDLVEEYSKRSLTKKTDKFSAISGLAKLLVEAPQQQGSYIKNGPGPRVTPPPLKLTVDNYKAGLWKSMFISDLAWRVVKPGSTDSGPIPYRAPSWSWGSVDGPVRFQDRESVKLWKYRATRRIDCTVDIVICEPTVPSDPTGPIKAAYALLTGPLVAAELVSPIPSLDHMEYSIRNETAAHRSCVRGKNPYEVEVALDRPSEVFQDRVYCFRLFTWEAPTSRKYGQGKTRTMPPEVWFLVLQRSPGDEAAFERIGVGFWDSRNHHPGCDFDLPLFDGAESTSIKLV